MISSELCYNKQTDSGLLPPLSVLSQRINFEDESIMNDKIIAKPLHPRATDLTGQQFGCISVLSYAGKRGKNNYWNVRCKCGHETIYRKWNLDKNPEQCQQCTFKDITGEQFGRLTVTGFAERKGYRLFWNANCSCGGKTVVESSSLKSGHTRSCGCLCREVNSVIHRNYDLIDGAVASDHPLFFTWANMIDRCYNVKSGRYSRYGKRGISVALRWRNSFHAFVEDMGPKPTPSHTLDRKFNDGDYAPANTRWATIYEQARNTSRTKLNEHLVIKLRARYSEGLTITEVWQELAPHINRQTVRSAILEDTWSDVCQT